MITCVCACVRVCVCACVRVGVCVRIGMRGHAVVPSKRDIGIIISGLPSIHHLCE